VIVLSSCAGIRASSVPAMASRRCAPHSHGADVEAGRSSHAECHSADQAECFSACHPRPLIGCGVCAALTFIVILFCVLSMQHLSPEDQVLVKEPNGNWVKNGPCSFFLWPHQNREWRRAGQLSPLQYAVIKNNQGDVRQEVGPKMYFLGPYDTLDRELDKIVLPKDKYIRLVDKLTGKERVLRGPQTVIPEIMEHAPDGVETAEIVREDRAVLVMTKNDGQQRLVKEKGLFFPQAYETVVKAQPLIRVLPHEAVVVRDTKGAMTVHTGKDGTASGLAFFLPPYSSVIEMKWTSYADPNDASVGRAVNVSKIDMRSHKMFFLYEVRTSDNVQLQLEGTIFWRVVDVATMVKATPDAEGDVWQHARSSLIQAVSRVSLSTFMSGFNDISMGAFDSQARDGFYADRGVEIGSMEFTRYKCVDAKTSNILEQIIQETTNRLNRLQQQRSENDVLAAKLQAEIQLEKQRTALIQSRAENARLEASSLGDADGLKLMRGAASFIDGLNRSLPNVDSRLELYKLHETLRSKNADMHSLASGNATLFLTPQDLNLKLSMGAGGAHGLAEL